jgi:N-acetylglucosaminyl-diphospho-decaprenol L-rhamnosyltransferase
MDRPSIHVVIVNWNSGTQLRECLLSFATVAADAVALRLSVIDNASTDGSCEGLEGVTSTPPAIIRNPDNRGFGAACNQGAAGSDADYLLFLNPDTRLMAGSLEWPARYLQAPEHSAAGIVGIQLLDADGRVARNTARTPTAWSAVGNSLGLDRLMPSVFPPHFVTEWSHDETQTVDQVMGAYFLVRRSLFDLLDGFDQRFFVYYEDLDFSVRARVRGFSSVYLATAQAFHRGQGTTENATERRMFYFARSKILYALKHFSAFGALAVVVATLTLEPLARMLARPKSAGEALRAFGNLWAELPQMLRTKQN